MDKWIGKTAVVTGASAGIGAQIVKDFTRKGINVIGLARRPEKVTEIATDLGETAGKVHAYKCDVSNRDSIKEAFEWIENEFKVIHILINNAGIGRNTNILSDNLDNGDQLDEIINTNFSGLVHVTRHAFQLMKNSGDYGLIVNVNSIMGHRVPFPNGGKSVVDNVYHGTKHAVTATTEILVRNLFKFNDFFC
jgi:NADP+-dependent farnesol dehydrogenase